MTTPEILRAAELYVSDAAKALLTKPHQREMWGQAVMCEPVFVDEVIGDGARLLGVTPINTRPNYYLIRIDSSWNLSNYAEEPLVSDHLDEIEEAIESQCGSSYVSVGESESGEDEHHDWPALSADSGVSWWDATDEFRKAAEMAGTWGAA